MLFNATMSANAVACHTVTAADHCFVHVQWAHSVGLTTHPEWYPTLKPSSSTFEDVQRALHSSPSEFAKYGCPEPCKPPAWEDPLHNHHRREAPHATLHPFESTSLAAANALDESPIEASSRVLMLSGPDATWRFHYSAEIHLRPSVLATRGSSPRTDRESSFGAPETPFVPFYSPAFNDTSWAAVPVPSNWEMLSFGVPIYVNIPCARSCAIAFFLRPAMHDRDPPPKMKRVRSSADLQVRPPTSHTLHRPLRVPMHVGRLHALNTRDLHRGDSCAQAAQSGRFIPSHV